MSIVSRRGLLQQSCSLGGALLAGHTAAPTAGALELDEPAASNPRQKVVVTGGHPGDPEYGCGGMIALASDLGHEVVLLYLNNGEREDQPDQERGVRVAEAGRACQILRARPVFAGQLDGKAVVDAPHYEAFRTLLAAQRPDAVFTHWPIDNHADHRAISMLVYEAWLRMGKRFALYYYEVSSGEDTLQFSPTHYVDITATEPRKRQACFAHASQSPDRFYALQTKIAQFRGIESGHKLAEAYIRHVQSPEFSLPH